MSLKKVFIPLFLFFFLVFNLSAQFSADPTDFIYGDLEIWEARGLVSRLPVMRPYPPQLLKELLVRVAERGGARDAARARAYLDELSQDFRWHIEAGGTMRSTTEKHYLDLYGAIEAGGWLAENMHLEGRARGMIMDNTSGFVLPQGDRPAVDIFDTWADVTVKGRKLFLRQNQNINFAAGGEELYFQAGIIRNSFGPFWGDGVVLSADAPHTGHYSVVWRKNWFSYSTALLELEATNYLWGDIWGKSELRFPNKHLIIQSFNFFPTPWLELGYFESIVWGGRMDLNYLLPFKELFYAQSMAGFEDNSFVGFMADIRPARNIKLPFIIYVDDAHLEDLLKFNFSTKFKVAAQGGIKWAPEKAGPLKMLAADYTMVTPYMYTHRSGLEGSETNSLDDLEDFRLKEPNYHNYTHSGTNLGVGLDPNSDRISLQLKLEPVKDLELVLTGRYMRHGNASENMVDDLEGRNDGTILDDGYDKNVNPTFHDKTNFLNQDKIEKTLQAGLQLRYSFPFWIGRLLVEGGYMFEKVDNYIPVADRDAYNRGNGVEHHFNLAAGFRY